MRPLFGRAAAGSRRGWIGRSDRRFGKKIHGLGLLTAMVIRTPKDVPRRPSR